MKSGIYITVRLGSSRLNRKAIKEVNNNPIIGYLISRIKHICSDLGDIVICTTNEKEDYLLDKIADDLKVACFHGEKDNLIKRHYDCAIFHNHKFVVNVDGDDIFCNPDYVKKIIKLYNEDKQYHVIKTEGLPFGTNSMGYRIEVLKKILNDNKNSKKIDTGWGEFIKNNKEIKQKVIQAHKDEIIDARLTLDYEEDFQLFKTVIENLNLHEKYVEQQEIVKYLKENQEVADINKHLNEIYWENYHSNKKIEQGE
ncbi:cytidylyltransferase domain-containing protein [Crassaminicella profunda]|uniref:cytidylyltransferase domain-containing protein n=1 Tax=Crassaminicella profunda TaxID=1286698 RepID=UPI001CA65888|nr:hypothetical protein [Crassaminicella profunda]QZY54304.1 hypothetical protein K7H06_14810 [Crassaminicella profunda]